MKKLYINDKEVIIDQNIYFPFVYKTNDLEEVNIIGVPQSKEVEIFRGTNNDEIFGYIGELSRETFNYDNNELVSVSFNQTKKGKYKLMRDSEIVSEGEIQVVSVDDIKYTVILYDYLVTLIEQFEGNSDTEKGFLSSMDLFKSDNTIFETQTNALNVYNLMNNSTDVVPVINITDFETTGSEIRCLDSTTSFPIDATLPDEFTPIQARTIKNYEVEYAVPLNTVIRSINKYQNLESSTSNIEYIKVDPELTDLFNEVHLNCGKPKKNDIPVVEEFVVDDLGQYNFNYLTTSNYKSHHTLNNNGVNYCKKNGNYYMNIPIVCTINVQDNNASKILTYYNGKTYAILQSNDYIVPTTGNKIGELLINTSITGWNNNLKQFETIPITNQLNMFFGINTTYNLDQNGKISRITVVDNIILKFDIYPEFGSIFLNKFSLDYTNFYSTTKMFSNNVSVFQNIDINLNQGTGVFTSLKEVRTNDIINGKMIYPKVSIKEFLINTCKFFNLDITNIDNVLNIKPKKYNKTSEVLNITSLNSVNVNLFNFNKLILSTDTPTNNLIETYNKNTKQVYGQKTIDTGYTIRQNIKKVNIGVGVPVLLTDTNKIAYDSFAGYFNAGESKAKYGTTEGFEDKIVFGYLNKITNDNIYLTNDTYYEGGMWSSQEQNNYPDGINFKMNNQLLVYNGNSDSFNFIKTSNFYGQSLMVDQYNTISPYKFDGDNIIESLEMYKPKYNYANILDSNYNETATLYNRFHKKILEDKYNVNGNVIDIDIYIDKVPNVYSIYNIKGVNYIIAELPEYDPTTDGDIIKGVKFLKVNDIYSYGAMDYYKIQTTSQLTFSGNIVNLTNQLLGFDYDTYGSSQVSIDNFKLIGSNFYNNSPLSVVYDSVNNKTIVSQTNSTSLPVLQNNINKIKVSNNIFNYLVYSDIQKYNIYCTQTATLTGNSGSGTINDQNLNQVLYLKSGIKTISEAEVFNSAKIGLECTESDGLFYWLLSAECYLKLNNATSSLSSLAQFKFDDITIQAREQVGGIYTTFTWGHSSLLDVVYTYLPDDSLKFSFRAMLFQGSQYSGTLENNVGAMNAIPYPSSNYNVKISLDGTYNDYIDSEDTNTIVFGAVGSNLSTLLDTFTGNNQSTTTITATNFKVNYNYTK